MNEKINDLIELFNLNRINGQDYEIIGESGEVEIYTKGELKDKIRKTLGIDMQCFQCLEFHFQNDLSRVEETGQLICEKCAEGIIGGSIKVKEI